MLGHLVLGVDFGRTFKKAGVEIEHITGIRLTTGRTAQDQGNLAIGDCLFRQVVVNDKGVLTTVAEILADGGAGKRSIVLQRGGISSCGRNDNRVGHCAMGFERIDDVGHRRGFLSNGHIDAVDRVTTLKTLFLIDYGVNGYGGLACLSVTDNQFALASADGDHRVDGFDAGLERLVHWLAVNHAGSLAVKGHQETLAVDGGSTVNGLAERVDDSAQHVLIDFDRHDFACTLGRHTFFDSFCGTQ